MQQKENSLFVYGKTARKPSLKKNAQETGAVTDFSLSLIKYFKKNAIHHCRYYLKTVTILQKGVSLISRINSLSDFWRRLNRVLSSNNNG